MGLALRFTWDMQNLFRVLFAINGTWDQDLKWTDTESTAFSIAPSRLSERIDAAFHFSDLFQAVQVEQELIVEVLDLAAAQGFDVVKAIASMSEGLQAGIRTLSESR